MFQNDRYDQRRVKNDCVDTILELKVFFIMSVNFYSSATLLLYYSVCVSAFAVWLGMTNVVYQRHQSSDHMVRRPYLAQTMSKIVIFRYHTIKAHM